MAARLCIDCDTVCTGTRCPECTQARRPAPRQRHHANATRDARRGTTAQRGYGARHRRLRAQWAPQVEAGDVNCWRCGKFIQPGQPWHLGHLDDRSDYGGPEHELCNLHAAGRAGTAPQRAKRDGSYPLRS